jgi:hypothetical protein
VLWLLAARAEIVPPPQARARKLIVEHKRLIGRFMHPTSTVDRALLTRTRNFDSGDFCLTYAFCFDGDRYRSSLRFRFFEDGSLDSIEVAGTTTWVKPFQAADLTLKAVAHLLPQPGGDRIAALLGDGAAKTALEFWLRSRP